jgi:hypothetical protein
VEFIPNTVFICKRLIIVINLIVEGRRLMLFCCEMFVERMGVGKVNATCMSTNGWIWEIHECCGLKGAFEFPNVQKLLIEYIEQCDGVGMRSSRKMNGGWWFWMVIGRHIKAALCLGSLLCTYKLYIFKILLNLFKKYSKTIFTGLGLVL